LFKYCCPGNLFNQHTCVADKLKHEEKYDGRIGELKIDTKTSFLPVLPSDEVDQVASLSILHLYSVILDYPLMQKQILQPANQFILLDIRLTCSEVFQK